MDPVLVADGRDRLVVNQVEFKKPDSLLYNRSRRHSSLGMRPPFAILKDHFQSQQTHASQPLTAILASPPADCFALYTAHDGEAHFSNYHALFGRTIPAGETATARVSLRLLADGGR